MTKYHTDAELVLMSTADLLALAESEEQAVKDCDAAHRYAAGDAHAREARLIRRLLKGRSA